MARASDEQQKRWRDSWWVRRFVGMLVGAGLAASCPFWPEVARPGCAVLAQAVGAAVRDMGTMTTPPPSAGVEEE